jgi:hypothetical protein
VICWVQPDVGNSHEYVWPGEYGEDPAVEYCPPASSEKVMTFP